jgi:DivIVA domain-containing protein
MRRKKQEAPADGGSTDPSASPRLTPEDVQRKEFRLAFRGYNERDVDAFLDEVTEELGAHLDENRRLRQQLVEGGPGEAAPASSRDQMDAADAARQADEILAAARAEAERIVAEARERADQVAAAAVAGPGVDVRAAIAPFLGREREFLQSLGKLVQEHAESVRGMVQAARDGRAPLAEAQATDAAEVPGSAAEAVAREPGPEPITVPEAEPAPAAGEAEQRAVPVEGGDPERQRSLRELFWGED